MRTIGTMCALLLALGAHDLAARQQPHPTPPGHTLPQHRRHGHRNREHRVTQPTVTSPMTTGPGNDRSGATARGGIRPAVDMSSPRLRAAVDMSSPKLHNHIGYAVKGVARPGLRRGRGAAASGRALKRRRPRRRIPADDWSW